MLGKAERRYNELRGCVKMHLRNPGPRWGSLERSPRSPSWTWERGIGKEEWKGLWMEREWKGRKGTGEKEKGEREWKLGMGNLRHWL